MLWGIKESYEEEPFEREGDLEAAIIEVADILFGNTRIYLNIKRKMGGEGKIKNIPDGYLIDLSSTREPKLFIIENELTKHDPLKHIAVQILEFSLSFETSPHLVKNILKEALIADPDSLEKCEKYVAENGFENIDVLLERIIYGVDRFNALVIIDELQEELEKVLISRFQFPIEIITIERFRNAKGQRLYRFDPFLQDVIVPEKEARKVGISPLDPSELDTIVVPAREDGFKETFLVENRWYAIRIHSSMISKIKYIAAYQVAPESAITHLASVASIEQWKDTSKYVVNFTSPADRIEPIRLVRKGVIKAPQAPRYTSRKRLETAKTLNEAFDT